MNAEAANMSMALRMHAPAPREVRTTAAAATIVLAVDRSVGIPIQREKILAQLALRNNSMDASAMGQATSDACAGSPPLDGFVWIGERPRSGHVNIEQTVDTFIMNIHTCNPQGN